ncbi:MAG: helix-turn-helix domain-containing protein [Ruminococcus sp.]|nr:helix-turn-helix domain-containing protein [Ruminococcus sp.]
MSDSEELYDFLYPIETDTQIRSVSEYIYQLRKKCRPFRINPIDTIYGIGYRMNSNTYAK